MKKEYLFLLGFILVIGLAIGTAMIGKSNEAAGEDAAKDSSTASQQVTIPQLESEGREDASTMVLLGTPPMQPADHIDRWNPEQRQDSCLLCHATPETTGAREIPENHYYDNDRTKAIFRDNCIQCHGQQNDTKSAFNSEE
ncbi:nitrate reductase cytochrome c-type subunit [Robertmurraya andreesenii]|uniref:Nitrate reductase cytochrome c-type subunit n=1 Tax=Anoxybacillus andreesenii TaxID=1325932 RepID=A0ABT9V6W5_9BACL|nr:nitrate reductase cytochrome c-type subunit [Robertmurraya andreesenii]MDQ0156696.1 nitrate reductase cytochrome c-type subunit [Robertmurraya andreesenii]